MDKTYKDIILKRKGMQIWVQRMARNIDVSIYKDYIEIEYEYYINEWTTMESKITIDLTDGDNFMSFEIN